MTEGSRGNRVMDSVGCRAGKSRDLNIQTKLTDKEKCPLKFHILNSIVQLKLLSFKMCFKIEIS